VKQASNEPRVGSAGLTMAQVAHLRQGL